MFRVLTDRPFLAAVLLAVWLGVCTGGVLHAAAHAGEGSEHCAACRVLNTKPLPAGAVAPNPPFLPACERVAIASADDAPPAALELVPAPRGPPSLA